jgi:hypothetical protein
MWYIDMKKIIYYYRSWKVWVMYYVDHNENQIGDAQYFATKRQAIEAIEAKS